MLEFVLGTEAAKKCKEVRMSVDVIGGELLILVVKSWTEIIKEIEDSPIRISLQLDLFLI